MLCSPAWLYSSSSFLLSACSRAGSVAAALASFFVTDQSFRSACEIAQAACKAFERQAALRPALRIDRRCPGHQPGRRSRDRPNAGRHYFNNDRNGETMQFSRKLSLLAAGLACAFAAHAQTVKETAEFPFQADRQGLGRTGQRRHAKRPTARQAARRACQQLQPDPPRRSGDGGANEPVLHLVRLAVGYGIEERADQPRPAHRRLALLQHQHDLLQQLERARARTA